MVSRVAKTTVPSRETETFSEEQIAHIRAVVGPRMAAYKAGTLDVVDFDTAFDEIEAEFFGDSSTSAQ